VGKSGGCCLMEGKVGLAVVSNEVVYVRYKDHVYFKNYRNPPSQAVERETVGWVKEENAELILIVCDKAVSNGEGQVNGLIILKSCILEKVELPLQRFSDEPLNWSASKKKSEYCASSQRSEKLTPQIRRKRN
jgi:hypothetical protein